MLHCIIAIACVADDNQFRKFIHRSPISSEIVRVYRPRHQDLWIKVSFVSFPRVLSFLKKNAIQYCVMKFV